MLTKAVKAYLEIRRALGFRLKGVGNYLLSFARFAEASGEKFVLSKSAIAWAGLGKTPPQRSRRLGIVIRLARYLHAEDHHHEIPPDNVFGSETRQRPVPFIFSSEKIQELVRAASRLPAVEPFLHRTFSTVFSLLACTGMRVSEAIKLRCQDFTQDGLLIRETKFRKSRLLPLHPTAETAMKRYMQIRLQQAPRADDHLFVDKQGRPLKYWWIAEAFKASLRVIGIVPSPLSPRPTLHSLRHTFAVRALETSPDGRDRVTKHTVALSTYLGHCNTAATYWYLEATPHLMTDIAAACDDLSGERS